MSQLINRKSTKRIFPPFWQLFLLIFIIFSRILNITTHFLFQIYLSLSRRRRSLLLLHIYIQNTEHRERNFSFLMDFNFPTLLLCKCWNFIDFPTPSRVRARDFRNYNQHRWLPTEFLISAWEKILWKLLMTTMTMMKIE